MKPNRKVFAGWGSSPAPPAMRPPTEVLGLYSLVILGLVLALTITSCDTADPESEETIFDVQGENGFVGTVNGTDAFIAVLVADDEAIVYACNGDEGIHEWFQGATDPEKISLTNAQGARIVGTFAGRAFTGNVTLANGTTHSFTASPNVGDEIGIVRVFGDAATEEDIVAGWILTPGDERGAFRQKGSFKTTPRIRDLTDGTSNTVVMGEVSVKVERFFAASSGSTSTIEMNGFFGK